jgi:3-hydroxyisobutyrate dehydrogenase
MKKIGFVGLGHMGNPMVKNLLKAGFQVKVFDVSNAAVQALVAQGAKEAKTVADVAVDADILITMLQTGEQVKAVCLGRDGLFDNSRPEIIYIDSSSIEVSTTHELHHEASRLGVMMVDAPVSGGVAGADAGTLTFMVGGSEENFLRVKPVLETMGKKIIHAGGIGHGQAAKICNNLILGVSMIAVAEAFNLAEKLGLDAKKFFEISSNASGQCWAMTSYCPAPGIVESAPSNHEYKAGFMTKMMLKDLRLGQHAAENVGASIPLATEAAELYSLFSTQGYGEMDFSGIIKMLAGTFNKTT